MASQSTTDLWMGAASSDISMPSNPVLNFEEDSSWKAPTSPQNTTNMDVVKDNVGTSRELEEESWYTPESSLMDLSYSPPYGNLSDPRSSFGSMLEPPSLNFDNTNNLTSSSSFRSAVPSTLGIQGLESNRLNLDDVRGSGVGTLLSSISPGGQLGRSNPMDSFSSGLPSSFNHGINIATGGSLSSITGSNMNHHNVRTSNFPVRVTSPASTFSDAYVPTQALNVQSAKIGKYISSGGPRTDQYNSGKRNITESSDHQGSLRGGQQQTLFQKRAASRRGAGTTSSPVTCNKSPPRVVTTSASNDSSADTAPGNKDESQQTPAAHQLHKLAHPQNVASGRVDIHSGSDDPNDMGLDADDYDVKDDDDLDESGDGSGGPYEVEEGADNGADQQHNGKAGNGKGKRGLPAKNLMAERRRRKKLNDRLYMLRSVVPKITKMDRASILGDAIEYLKELLQRINDIHKELEAGKVDQSRSIMAPSSPPPVRSVHNHGYRSAIVKEENPLLPNPESQPPRVEVRKRDGQALNIHMFCARRPGLLLSTVRALDALGLDVQQAVISCFNGFALDLFRAEANNMEVGPDEIKAVLLLTAGCGMHTLQ